MDTKEFKLAVDLLVKERGIDKDIIYEALELALTSAYKKNYHSLFPKFIFIDFILLHIIIFIYPNIINIHFCW